MMQIRAIALEDIQKGAYYDIEFDVTMHEYTMKLADTKETK